MDKHVCCVSLTVNVKRLLQTDTAQTFLLNFFNLFLLLLSLDSNWAVMSSVMHWVWAARLTCPAPRQVEQAGEERARERQRDQERERALLSWSIMAACVISRESCLIAEPGGYPQQGERVPDFTIWSEPGASLDFRHYWGTYPHHWGSISASCLWCKAGLM